MIKVAITDDHAIVVDGLRNVLKNYPNIMITGMYRSGMELMQGIQHEAPDVLLLDLQLPDQTGYEVAKEVLKDYPSLRILVFSSIESSLVVQDMMKAGCRGYLQKTTTNKELLVRAINEVYQGKIFLEPELQQQLLENVLETNSKNHSLSKQLTAREKDVLKLIAHGYSNQQIADKLYVSLRTVESHRYNLLHKLDVKNAIGLVKAAMQMGLMD